MISSIEPTLTALRCRRQARARQRRAPPRSCRSRSPAASRRVRTAWRSMSSARASICSARLEPDPERRRRARVARRAALRRSPPGPRERHGLRSASGATSSGWSQSASATTPTAATAGIHQTRRPACQRLKKTRMSAVSTAMSDEDEPRVVRAEDEREVAREHREEHGEREVVVVHRAVLRLEQRRGVRLALLLHRRHELPVRRDDHEEDVRGHDRPEHHADLEVGRARREELARRPRPRARRARSRRRRARPGCARPTVRQRTS